MKFIDLETQYNLLKNEINENIQKVLEHGQYIMGPEVYDLENFLGRFVDAKHTVTCSSGTDALLMSLMALGVKSGDYVLTTPFTYIATAEVISLIGAIPKFIDIDSETFNMDINKLEEELKTSSNQYKYIMPVNIFGAPLDYSHLEKLKNKYDLVIIEDAAQSFGADYNGRKSGMLGDVGCTSFYPAKPLGCYGDGGAIFTNDSQLALKLKSIREHGAGEDKYNNIRLGINGRLDTIQAAILIPKLKIFNQELAKRNIIAMAYKDRLQDIYKSQVVLDGCSSSWAQFSILCKNANHRELLISKLKDNGIPAVVYYITPLHLQDVFNDLGYEVGSLPITEDICSRVLSLPMNPYLADDDIQEICNLILGV